MNTVILDSFIMREGDLDWSALEALSDTVRMYPRTPHAQIASRIADADVAVLNRAYIDDAILDACPKLRLVCVMGTGIDGVDTAACRRHGVDVANVPGYSGASVAQHTLALLMALCDSVGVFDAAVRDGRWQEGLADDSGVLPPHELAGSTLGLVGFGDIAQRVAVLGQALCMEVVCYTRTVRPEYGGRGVEFLPLAQLLQSSDVLSLHCPAAPATTGILNADSLAQCRRGVLVVNTARGALVDEQAMADALESGQVGGYAADAFLHEPVQPNSPLLTAPHTVFTPHIAWATPAATRRLTAAIAENVRAFFAGDKINIVN